MPQSTISGMISLLGILGIFILVLFLAYYFTKYFGKRYSPPGGQNGCIQIVDRAMLGPERALFVVKAAGKVYLLGVTAQHVEKIDELDAQDLPEPAAPTIEQASFMDFLKNAVKDVQPKNKKDRMDG